MMRYQSRKFILALLMLAIGTTLTYFGMLTELLVDLLKWTGGLYFGFNVSQKAAEWVSAGMKKVTSE